MSASELKEPFLVLSGVRYTWPGAAGPALDGIDLSVGQGTVYGILGPNGAGKSTLVRVLSGLLTPDEGEVGLGGRSPSVGGAQVRRMIGIVPQEIAVYEEFTPRENLEFFARLYGLSGSRLKSRVAACLDRAGLAARDRDRVHTLSGGMKRRVNLACGLVHQPALLLLDEPTVGIDAHSREMILSWLAELPGEGTTLIYTTHYMEEAERLCRRIAVIDQGRVICEGIPAELLAARNCQNLGELFLNLTGRGLKER